ncbi:MAG: glycosyltransferase family 4 protein [Nanoarchaeota archaeon]|nr:glycosyltransferase family 4 protein [Nanoarchaeota archaeon]
MKVLMFGWEFPPMSSGGLGTACYGLTKGLSNHNIDVTFVLPYAPGDTDAEYVKLIPANDLSKVKIVGVNSIMRPYITSSQYESTFLSFGKNSKQRKLYGENLQEEVYRFSLKATLIAEHEDFDVIHCHDWMTYLAGINAKLVSGKPLVMHVHATEFDRTGGNVNQEVYDAERRGMYEADMIIAVSQFTKDKIVRHYGISPDKIVVVHNAVDLKFKRLGNSFNIDKKDKVVLFVGRVTLQKGPDYFIEAAKKCLEFDPNIRFIIAGSGDMEGYLIERSAELGIGDKVLFAGFVTGDDLDRLYQMADVYVMPSVSEPFGITPLEAMKNETPVIISKQSGVAEVINHCLKVDFWDINQLVDKILAVLKYEELNHTLKYHGSIEVRKFNWNEPAEKCIGVYNKVMRGVV